MFMFTVRWNPMVTVTLESRALTSFPLSRAVFPEENQLKTVCCESDHGTSADPAFPKKTPIGWKSWIGFRK